MKKVICRLFAIAALTSLFSVSANASMITTLLGPVEINGAHYDVSFVQADAYYTSFDDVYGAGTPDLTFHNFDDARGAVLAILAVLPNDFDVTPYTSYHGFRVAYGATASHYDYLTGVTNLVSNPYGPFTQSRTILNNVFSFAMFTPAEVPEPATLGLMGLGLLGLVAHRRRRAS